MAADRSVPGPGLTSLLVGTAMTAALAVLVGAGIRDLALWRPAPPAAEERPAYLMIVGGPANPAAPPVLAWPIGDADVCALVAGLLRRAEAIRIEAGMPATFAAALCIPFNTTRP